MRFASMAAALVLFAALTATACSRQGRTSSPLQRLEGTWNVTCRISKMGSQGGVFSQSTTECPSDSAVTIAEKERGILSGACCEGYLYFLFTLKSAPAPNRYLLTMHIQGLDVVDGLSLSYTEAAGFHSETSGNQPLGSITFAQAGSHAWRVQASGIDVNITFRRGKTGP